MARRARTGSPSLLQTREFVQLALSGVEREIQQTRERLTQLQTYAAQLRSGAKGATAPPPPAAATGSKANRLSPAARKALSARMRRKWAEFRKAKAEAAKPAK